MAINPQAVRGPVTAVPVVAGKGVRFVEDTENNRVVAEVDETVLWEVEGTPTSITSDTNLTLSESVFNFERVKIYFLTSYGASYNQSNSVEAFVISNSFEVGVYPTYSGSAMSIDQNSFVFSTSATTTCTVKSSNKRTDISSSGSFSSTSNRGVKPLRIVGINRVSA